MRHFFVNDTRPKLVAKSIRTELSRFGHKISHSDSLLISARLYHYRNWSDLLAQLGKRPPSLDDHCVDAEVVKARFEHHVETLSNFGIQRGIAESVVTKVGPTKAGVRLRLGREDLWIDDPSVAAYLESVADMIAAEAVEVTAVRHGTWTGFSAVFGERRERRSVGPFDRMIPIPRTGRMLFGVSHDGRSAVLRNDGEVSFERAVDDRISSRYSITPPDWDFLDSYDVSGNGTPASAASKIIAEVFSLLHVPTVRALRSRGRINENDYETVVASDKVRAFLHRYPSLADHCIWSMQLGEDNVHIGSRRWIENLEPQSALMAIMTQGKTPSGMALQKAVEVASALQYYAVTSDHRDTFSTEALAVLAQAGPTALPTSKSEMRALIQSADAISDVIPFGMDMERALVGYTGSWKAFRDALRTDKAEGYSSGIKWFPDSLFYLVCCAFGQTYGIETDILYGANFSEALESRLGPSMMSRMTLVDIAALLRVIMDHKAGAALETGHRYPTVSEANELAALYTLPMPEIYHGKTCIEILQVAGYDPDALAGMLKIEPDLTFDGDGFPVMEQRFKGLDRSTYAIQPLVETRDMGMQEKPHHRPHSVTPPSIPEAPKGWVFDGVEFKSDRSMYVASRIRWSDGFGEIVGDGAGWYADRAIRHTNDETDPRCPLRLGRFDSPQAAADAILAPKGFFG